MVNNGYLLKLVNNWNNVGKTMQFLPPMTGKGKFILYTTYKNGDDRGMVYEIVFTILLLS